MGINEMQPVALAQLLKDKREAILQLAEKHGAYNVRIFGSVVRGEAGPESDVDFLVAVETGRSLLDLVGLWQDLEDLLGRKVDVVSEGGVSPYLQDQIFAEAISL